MGRINLQHSFASSIDSVAFIDDSYRTSGTTATRFDEIPLTNSSSVLKQNSTEHVEDIKYPRLSRSVADSQLPFVTADEVAIRTGIDGEDLCTFSSNVIPTK